MSTLRTSIITSTTGAVELNRGGLQIDLKVSADAILLSTLYVGLTTFSGGEYSTTCNKALSVAGTATIHAYSTPTVNGTFVIDGATVGEATCSNVGGQPDHLMIRDYTDSRILATRSWSVQTANRSVGVTYTNSTNSPIMVSIGSGTVAAGRLSMEIGGVEAIGYPASNLAFPISVIVPVGFTYLLKNATIQSWAEFR